MPKGSKVITGSSDILGPEVAGLAMGTRFGVK
jgi:hypothetical protein